MAYDPYAIANQPRRNPLEYNERGDSMNGYTGSKTSASMRNAALNTPAPTKGGNVFAEMVQYGRRPSGIGAPPAGRRRAMSTNPGSIPMGDDGVGTFIPSIPGINPGGAPNPFGRTASGMSGGGTQWQPANIPPMNEPGPSSNPFGLQPFSGEYFTEVRRLKQGDPGTGPGGRGAPIALPLPAPSPALEPRKQLNPGLRTQPDTPGLAGLGGLPQTFGGDFGYGPGVVPNFNGNPPTGTVQGANPFAGRTASGMGSRWQEAGLPPMNEPGPRVGSSFSEFNDPFYTQMREDGFRPGGFNPGGPALPGPSGPRPPAAPSTQPPPAAPNRPPATPSTQPPPTGPASRPPARPSTQPPPNPFQPGSQPPGAGTTYMDPRTGSTTGRNPNTAPNPFQSAPEAGRFTTYYNPTAGGTTHTPPPSSGGRTSTGMGGDSGTSPWGPEFDQNGKLLTNNAVGVRYKSRAPEGTPDAFRGAGGEATQNWVTIQTPDGPRKVLADYNGNVVSTNGSYWERGQPAPTAPAAGGGTPGSSTSTTTGTLAAPNSSTTFDPNVLPSSNVGDWFDPIAKNAMEQVRQQAMHTASLTGLTNNGGFVPGLTQELGNVANQFAAQKGQLQFQDQQAKADRLLDQYKFDNTQQLTKWIEENRQELERYGIDTNALVQRYSADQGLKAAGLGADASRFAARTGADASRYNAGLDFMSQIYGTDMGAALGRERLGFDYYDAGNRYNLGLYGTDAQREANMMDYLSRIYGLGPEYLRLLMGSDPSQLIPGMAPGNSVTIM